jgi:hypothetical protein
MSTVRRGWVTDIALCCAAIIGLAPAECEATPTAEEQASEPPADAASSASNARHWYGWQTFAADGVAGALFLGAVADDNNVTLFGLSGVSFVLGAPTIHVVHGRWGVGLGSLGLRILGPFVGAVIGAQADVRSCADVSSCGPSSSKWGPAGAAIGGLVVSAIDGTLLAYDTPVASPAPPRNQLLRLEPLPQLVVLQHGLALGYSGQF